jgi:drug/metabolite transporter (DMT)-like permease
MGVALSFVAMVAFASNILVTRYALARMPLDAGFFIVLAVNILFPAALFAVELAVRAAPWSWDWRGAGLFAAGGVIGTYIGRRMLFDAVRLLGPARASVFHSTAPLFSLIGAWLFAEERLGLYELAIMVVVMAGLLFTQPRSTYTSEHPDASALRTGMLAGIAAVAGFGMGDVVRGIGVRDWNEPILGAVIASITALLCQVATTRNWSAIGAQLRAADRTAVLLYAACGVFTTLGAIFLAIAMRYMEIALAVLVVHSTPLVIFPVSVFILRNREDLTPRTVMGAVLVLVGIAFLVLR